ncbi:hypothetical protein [Sodalis sp. dw_96]|nr:hypothetical protein [Sodalis sp. dw_96]
MEIEANTYDTPKHNNENDIDDLELEIVEDQPVISARPIRHIRQIKQF